MTTHEGLAAHLPAWSVVAATLICATQPVIASEPVRGTPAGHYATRMVDRGQYECTHAGLLYTHDPHSRQFGDGAEHDAARDAIQARFASYGLATEQLQFSYWGDPGADVIAEILGTTRPDEIYIVGAHYDSYNWSIGSTAPGADDNASGVAAVLEMARILSAWPAEATIRFIAFDCEELGFVGSDIYATNHADDDIRGMLSLDMLAYHPSPTLAVYLAGRATSGPLKSALAAAFAEYAGLETIDVGAGDFSDHAPFEWQGFQAAAILEVDAGVNANVHTPADSVDTYDYIDYDYAVAITRGALGWLVNAAGVTPALLAGDANCDAAVDLSDLDAFVLALAGEADYEASYPNCRWLNSDWTGDGMVSFDDINAFVAALTAPCSQPQLDGRLTPADPAEYGAFGYALALCDDTLTVGAFGDDDQGATAGAIYAYARVSGSWTPSGKLTRSDGAAGELFGFSLGCHGDTLLVGAPGDDQAAADAGSADIYTRSADTWVLAARLLPSDLAVGDNFGYAVALQGDTAAVGAPYVDDGGVVDCGAVYVFQRQAGIWTLTQKLVAPDKADSDWFGCSVALDADTIIIGSPGNDDTAADAGCGSVYEYMGGQWTRVAKVLPADGPAHGLFGHSASISGDTLVLGGADGASTAGAAHVFTRKSDTRAPAAQLVPWYFPGPVAVALSGDQLVIGRFGGPFPDRAGCAYLYQRTRGTWTAAGQMSPWAAAFEDSFGSTVAIGGDTVAVGTPWMDSSVADAGAVYMGHLHGDGSPWIAEQPTDHGANAGESVSFRVTVVGPGQLCYQWQKDGEPLVDGANISGSATAELTILSAGPGDVGLYDAVISGPCGAVTSSAASLTLTGQRASGGADVHRPRHE